MNEAEYKGVHARLTFTVSWGKVTELPVILTLDFSFLLFFCALKFSAMPMSYEL